MCSQESTRSVRKARTPPFKLSGTGLHVLRTKFIIMNWWVSLLWDFFRTHKEIVVLGALLCTKLSLFLSSTYIIDLALDVVSQFTQEKMMIEEFTQGVLVLHKEAKLDHLQRPPLIGSLLSCLCKLLFNRCYKPWEEVGLILLFIKCCWYLKRKSAESTELIYTRKD